MKSSELTYARTLRDLLDVAQRAAAKHKDALVDELKGLALKYAEVEIGGTVTARYAPWSIRVESISGLFEEDGHFTIIYTGTPLKSDGTPDRRLSHKEQIYKAVAIEQD